MSPNRKADLQRKLAMAPIPKPPAGLAERIKSDIPQHLLVDVRQERERLSRSIAFNLRVAASIILLVGSVYLALRVMTRAEVDKTAAEMPSNVVVQPKAGAAAAPPVNAPARVAEATPPPVGLRKAVAAPKTVPAPAPEPKQERARARDEEQVTVGRNAADYAAPTATTAAAPPPAAAAAPLPVVAETGDAKVAPRAAAKANGWNIDGLSSANAAALSYAPATLFDIVIPRAGAELEGQALIQHFAAPAEAPHALRVDVESAAFYANTLLRVSVDTPEVAHVEGGSRPPFGADATLDVAFNDDAVASHKALAGSMHATERVLPSATSVTALYDVELKPDLDPHATIATVTLRYRSVADGKEHVVPHKLRASDVRAWRYATKRMKSASLAAALVYKLDPPETIAEKARAAGLDELADLAERP
jgi:hypothetical protein